VILRDVLHPVHMLLRNSTSQKTGTSFYDIYIISGVAVPFYITQTVDSTNTNSGSPYNYGNPGGRQFISLSI
jgi:hypothetical protein